MSTCDDQLRKLAAQYEAISVADPARIEAEKAMDGYESRDYYRGFVEALVRVFVLLDSFNIVLPRFVSCRLTAFAAKASTLALPMPGCALLRNPEEGEMYEAFVTTVGHWMLPRQWRRIMKMIDMMPAGYLRGEDYSISWTSQEPDYFVTIRGGQGALDSL